VAQNIDINIVAQVKKAVDSLNNFSKQATSSFKNVESAVNNANKTIAQTNKSFVSLANVAKIAAGAFIAFQAVKKIAGFFSDATKAAVEYEKAIRTISAVSERFGIDTKKAEQAVNELAKDGLVPLAKVADGVKNLLSSGLGLDESTKLFNALKDITAANVDSQQSLDDAIVSVTEGLRKNRNQLIQNAVPTLNIDKAQRLYAESIGTTVDKLTKQQKTLATYNALLKESENFTGAATKLSNTFEGSTARLSDAFNTLNIAIGQFITGSSSIKDANFIFAEFLEGVARGLTIVREIIDGTSEGVKNLSFLFLGLAKSLDNTVFETFSKNFLRPLAADLQKVAEESKKTTKEVNKIAKEVSNIDVEQVQKLESSLNSLTETLKKNTQSELQNLKDLKIERLKIAEDAIAQGGEIAKKGVKLRLLIEKDFNKGYQKILDDKNKREKESADRTLKIFTDLQAGTNRVIDNARQAVSKLAANPTEIFIEFGIITDDFVRQMNLLQEALKQNPELTAQLTKEMDLLTESLKKAKNQATLSAVGGALSSVAQGAEGAKKLVTDLAKTGVNAILGEAGKAFGPLIDSFTQGPDVVRQMVRDFTAALPDVITALIDGAVAFVDELVNQLPAILNALIEALPQLVEGIGKIIVNLLDKLPEIIVILINGLIEALPAIFEAIGKAIPDIVIALIDGIVKAIPILIQAFIDLIVLIIEKLPDILIALIEGIVEAIPDLIVALIDALPKLIDALIRSIPRLIDALVSAIPNLIKAIIDSIPRIISAFIRAIPQIIQAIISAIPQIVNSFINALINGAGQFVQALIDSIGGGISDGVSSIGSFLGFAKGGQVNQVPAGFNNDSFPAMLTSGELVVDRSTAFALKEFLANQGTNTSEIDVALLSKLNSIEQLLSNPQVVSGDLNIGYSVLSEAILKLNRSNARLA
jgi:phage-related protein